MNFYPKAGLRQGLIITCLFIFPFNVFSQQYGEASVSELKTELDRAVADKDYDKAHLLQSAIELKGEIDKAVADKDYDTAARLQRELEQLGKREPVAGQQPQAESQPNNAAYPIEFYNTVYVHNGTDFIPLERMDAELRTSSYSAVWVSGSSTFWEVPGMRSSVQINNEKDYTFYVKLNKGVDPVPLFKLHRLNILGKEKMKRSLLSNKVVAAAYAGASSQKVKDNEVAISFEKVSDEVYKISIDEVIPPSEYAFTQGNKWYLFGSRNQYTNSGKSIETRDFMGPSIFNEDGEYGRTVWLGYDYSMLRIKTKDGLEVDHEHVVNALQQAVDKINFRRQENDREVGNLFRRDRGMLWNPIYMNEYNEEHTPLSYVIPVDQQYELTDEMIRENLREYEVNYPTTGIVVIPFLIDMDEKELRGRAVWFDFDTREIVYSIDHVKRLYVREKFDEGEIWADFYDYVKGVVDSQEYKQMIKEFN